MQASDRCCQSNANQSPKYEATLPSGRQLTPLGQRGRAVLLEDVAAVEVAVEVEMIVDRSVNGGKFLQGFDALNFAIAPSRRRNGWCEFSARLLSQRPLFWRSETPTTFIAARYDRRRSVTIDLGGP